MSDDWLILDFRHRISLFFFLIKRDKIRWYMLVVVDEMKTHFQIYHVTAKPTYPIWTGSSVVEQMPAKGMVVSSSLTRSVGQSYGSGYSADNAAWLTYINQDKTVGKFGSLTWANDETNIRRSQISKFFNLAFKLYISSKLDWIIVKIRFFFWRNICLIK